jgi:hypothetical protein
MPSWDNVRPRKSEPEDKRPKGPFHYRDPSCQCESCLEWRAYDARQKANWRGYPPPLEE